MHVKPMALLGALALAAFGPACQCGDTVSHLDASVQYSPTVLDFGKVPVSATKPLPLTISNQGNFTLRVDTFTTDGPFTVTQDPVSLMPGADAKVQVTFAPTVTGAASGTLHFNTNDPKAKTVAVDLAGTGIEAAVVVSPAMVDFGQVDWFLGSPTAFQSVQISNPGSDSFDVTSITVTDAGGGAFTVDPSQAVRTFAPGDKTSFQVGFLPTTLGKTSGTVTIATTAPSAATVAVPLQGEGVGPAMTVCTTPPGGTQACTPSAIAVDFGPVVVGQTAAASITVKNDGNRDMSLQKMQLGSNSGDFTITPALATGGDTIAAGQNEVFELDYTPSGYGNDSSTITVMSNARGNPLALIAVTGRASRPNIKVDPGGVSFSVSGSTSVPPTTVNVWNCGDDPLVIGTITFTFDSGNDPAAISVQNDTASGQTFPPLGPTNCQANPAQGSFDVVFSSTVAGNYTAHVDVPSNDPINQTTTVQITATKN